MSDDDGCGCLLVILGAVAIFSMGRCSVNSPTLESRDVIEGRAKERFYQLSNEKAYTEIDGISVEDYFSQRRAEILERDTADNNTIYPK